jgi:hypothetical protein
MSVRLLRSALIGALFLVATAASDFATLAKAANSPTAHESAVLDRIFANWKARQDRVRSFHFVYDCRTTYRKGSPNPRLRLMTPLDHDEVFEQVGAQVWMDGDERLSWVEPSQFKVPDANRMDVSRVVFRNVIVGNSGWWQISGPLFEPSNSATRAQALYYPASGFGRLMPVTPLHALLLNFRPQRPAVVTWAKDQCRLVSEQATVDNGQYVEFQRVIQRGARPFEPRREEKCWVSPGRGDVVVHWTTEMPGEKFGVAPAPNFVGAIKYKKDKTYGWITSEWTYDVVGRSISEFKVTSYSINEQIDPAVFSQDVPPGTPVEDNRTNPSRFYVIQRDGSQSPITIEDYRRLINPEENLIKQPAKKNERIKPPVK